ncbi:17219_t:CDS:1, partial [Racocetra fulgida]
NNLASQINIPAINLPAYNYKLNLVAYPDFFSEEQDFIIWLEDIEKAFKANQVQDNCKIPVFISHLKRTVATWWVVAKLFKPLLTNGINIIIKARVFTHTL